MREAPYPSDTRAKGWRFEFDYELIEQSDTWDLAGPEARPWLLMMWLVSWRQVPCGSFPSDEQVIAAKIGMTPKMWAKHRAVLLRGWQETSDGRLYHSTITARVLEMMRRRRSDSDRKASERTRKTMESPVTPTDVTRDSAGVTPESSTDNRIPEPIEIPPIPPKGGKPAIGLKAWLDAVKAAGKAPIPDDDPVFAYAGEVGIPPEFLRLAWLEFRHRYTQPEAKRYRDWRGVFRKAVRGNWGKLWWLDPSCGQYALTTVGMQAQRAHQERRQA